MREFKSLKPQNLPEGFDLEIHAEAPIVEVKESKDKIVLDYSFPGFYLADDTHEVEGKKPGFKKLEIESVGFLSESGKPLLPSFGRYVQVPRNCDYKWAVRKSKPVQFDSILVTPAQMNVTDSPDQEHKFEYDDKFYANDALYPQEIVKVTGPVNVEDYNVLLVHVTPLQYNPAKKTLIGYGNVVVTIEVKQRQQKTVTSASPVDNQAFGNLLLNPGKRIDEKLGFPPGPVVMRPSGPEFLIIYAGMYKQAAEKLSNWKNHRGILTETVCVDTIGNDTDKLKTYIRGRRGTIFSRLRYALLLGDTDVITPETGLTCAFGPGTGCSDYYYSTRYDPKKPDPSNPKQIWFMPWLSIGRIPVRTGEEGMGVVQQIIDYEKNPPADQAFYKRVTLAAAYQPGRNYLQTINDIYQGLDALGYHVERVYVNDYPGPTVPPGVPIVSPAVATQMLIDATNEGQLFVGHRDHGNWDGWVHPPFKLSDLDKVTSELPSIFYSINCQTGIYDYPAPTECWAEKNLRMKGTAPSLIAATRNSHTFLNDDLIMGIFDGSFGGILPTFPGGTASYPMKNNRIGDLLNYGKSYLPIVMSGGDDLIKDHFQIYHVIGDPTLELWTDVPRTINVMSSLL